MILNLNKVVTLDDIERFAELDIIASFQPTHATSDKNMAEDRVGSERIKGAYAWQRMLDDYNSEDLAQAKQAAGDLLGWLLRGGFPPQVLSSRSMDDAWNRSVAESACRFVISQREI